MGIDLTWRDANGRELDSVGDSDFHFANIVQRVRDDGATPFRIMKTIDPYGVTRFAPPQVTTLLREVEALRNQIPDPVVTLTLGRFLSVLRAAEGTPDAWLEFVGD